MSWVDTIKEDMVLSLQELNIWEGMVSLIRRVTMSWRQLDDTPPSPSPQKQQKETAGVK